MLKEMLDHHIHAGEERYLSILSNKTMTLVDKIISYQDLYNSARNGRLTIYEEMKQLEAQIGHPLVVREEFAPSTQTIASGLELNLRVARRLESRIRVQMETQQMHHFNTEIGWLPDDPSDSLEVQICHQETQQKHNFSTEIGSISDNDDIEFLDSVQNPPQQSNSTDVCLYEYNKICGTCPKCLTNL